MVENETRHFFLSVVVENWLVVKMKKKKNKWMDWKSLIGLVATKRNDSRL